MKKVILLLTLLLCSTTLTACLITTPPDGDHTHVYGEWKVTREATCAEAGEKVRTCTCGHSETARVSKEMHVRGECETILDPTCTAVGKSRVCCTECGAEIVTSDIAMIPHDLKTVSIVSPTCDTDGYTNYACRDCEYTEQSDITEFLGHSFVDAVYNCDATAIKNGTATGYCTVCEDVVTGEIKGSADLIRNIFAGKNVSVMGDSISTYVNISNGEAAKTTNSTIKGNSLYYNGVHNEVLLDNDVNKTWWMRTINHLGASLLVNNSDSGGFILDYKSNGNKPAYLRADQLHDDTGDNAGTEPDMIFIYLGTNDFSRYGKTSTHFSLDDVDFDALDEMCDPEYQAKTVAEAYAILLYKLTTEYENADIYCLSLIEATPWHTNGRDKTIDDFHAMIAELCDYFGASFVDVYHDSGINSENLNDYVPIYDGDDTDNLYHPNAAGFALISDVLLDVIISNTEDYPTYDDFMALLEK